MLAGFVWLRAFKKGFSTHGVVLLYRNILVGETREQIDFVVP
jgi:hypothetical protein